mgnify:CR=1 FL=1
MSDILQEVEVVLAARRGADPESSYVASLYARGPAQIAKKLGEEAVETAIAAQYPDDAALVSEAADVVFHLLVLLADRGLALADVERELARRFGVSGHAEKAARGQPKQPDEG